MPTASDFTFMARRGRSNAQVPGKLLEPAPQLPPTPQRIANAAGADYFAFGHTASTGFAQASDDAVFCASSVSDVPALGPGKTVVVTLVPLSSSVNNPDIVWQHCNGAFSRGSGLALGGAGHPNRFAAYIAGVNGGNFIDLPSTNVTPHLGTPLALAMCVTDDGQALKYAHSGDTTAHSVALTGTAVLPSAGDPIAFGRAILQSNWLASAQLSQAVFADFSAGSQDLLDLVAASSSLVVPAIPGETFRLDAGLWAFGASSQKIGCAGNVMLRNGGYAGVNVQLAP